MGSPLGARASLPSSIFRRGSSGQGAKKSLAPRIPKGKSREQRQHQIKREKKAKKIIGKASASHGSRRQGAGTAPAKSNKKKRIRDTRKRNLELAANAMVEA